MVSNSLQLFTLLVSAFHLFAKVTEKCLFQDSVIPNLNVSRLCWSRSSSSACFKTLLFQIPMSHPALTQWTSPNSPTQRGGIYADEGRRVACILFLRFSFTFSGLSRQVCRWGGFCVFKSSIYGFVWTLRFQFQIQDKAKGWNLISGKFFGSTF